MPAAAIIGMPKVKIAFAYALTAAVEGPLRDILKTAWEGIPLLMVLLNAVVDILVSFRVLLSQVHRQLYVPQDIPDSNPDIVPLPVLSRTLTAITVPFLQTPTLMPATVPATCVPWPFSSVFLMQSVKSVRTHDFQCTYRRAGNEVCTPQSSSPKFLMSSENACVEDVSESIGARRSVINIIEVVSSTM